MRSMLFAPGDKPAILLKSLVSEADAVIWDLEDAVAPAAKASARAAVAASLRGLEGAQVPVVVRINAPGAGMLGDDLDQVVIHGLHGVLLAKTESAADVHRLDRELARLERARGIAEGATRVYCLVETCLGITNAFAIASASPRVDAPVAARARQLLRASGRR